jgi:hypothetical protein
MACGHPIIQPPVVLLFLEGPFMGPSLGQAVEGFHGVGAVVEFLVAGEGFVDSSSKE